MAARYCEHATQRQAIHEATKSAREWAADNQELGRIMRGVTRHGWELASYTSRGQGFRRGRYEIFATLDGRVWVRKYGGDWTRTR